jgi:membrane protein DedA with SNARE-associated domain
MKMENKGLSNFFWGIIAVILGVTLFKKFDFENLKFEKPWLAIVYIICFSFAIYGLITNAKNQKKP